MKNKFTFLLTALALLACIAFTSGRAEAQSITTDPTSLNLTYEYGDTAPEGQLVQVVYDSSEEFCHSVVVNLGTGSNFQLWKDNGWSDVKTLTIYATEPNLHCYFDVMVRLKPGLNMGSYNESLWISARGENNVRICDYSIELTGTVTEPTYHISFDLGVENGNYHGYVIPSPGEDVKQGTTVTLTPMPEQGYAFSSWTVNKQQGNAWVVDNSVTINANNQFDMPDHDIQIVPTFVPTKPNPGRYFVSFETDDGYPYVVNYHGEIFASGGDRMTVSEASSSLMLHTSGVYFSRYDQTHLTLATTTDKGRMKPTAIRVKVVKMDGCSWFGYSINGESPKIAYFNAPTYFVSTVELEIPSNIERLETLKIESKSYYNPNSPYSIDYGSFQLQQIEVEYEPAVTLSQNQFMLEASVENQQTASAQFTVDYSGLTSGTTVEFHVQEGFQNGTVTFSPASFTPSTPCGTQNVTVSWTPDHASSWEYASCYMKCDALGIWYEHIGVNTCTTDHPCYTMRPELSFTEMESSQSAVVNWAHDGEDPTRWKVQCSPVPTFPEEYTVEDGSVNGDNILYTFEQLSTKTTYYVRVAPWCEAASEFGPWSNVVSFTTPDPCGLPTNVEVTETEAYNFTVSFQPAAPEQTEWVFFWSNEFGASPSTMAVVNNDPGETVTATLGNTETLAAGAFYYLWVGTKCGDETNWPSLPTTQFTTKSDCDAPTNLTASDVSYTSATITWAAGSANQTSWIVALDTQEWGEPREYVTNTPSITFTSDDFNTENDGNWDGWQWHVTVVGDCGQGYGYSDASEISFTTNMAIHTVNGNTNGNSECVPLSLYNLDVANGTKSQFIIPASYLSNMGNSTIQKMTFYAAEENIDFGNATFNVYVKQQSGSVVFEEEAPAFFEWDNMTKVLNTGSLAVDANRNMVVTFDTPFTYTEGNLVIGFQSVAAGEYCNDYHWIGVSTGTNNSSAYYRKGDDGEEYTGFEHFLPKVTFGYIPSPCDVPTDFVYTDITSTSATVSWTSNADRHIFQYKKEDDKWWHQYQLDNGEMQYQLTGLEPGVTYLVRVCALCSSGSTDNLGGSFNTLHAAPANLTCTGVTVNTASFNWEDNSQPQNGWVMELYSDQSLTTPRGTFTSSETNFTITGVDDSDYPYLEQNKTYWVRVRGDYSENVFGEWTEALEFTTGAIKTFMGTQTESGFNTYWSEPANWNPSGLPTMSDNVNIYDSPVVTSGIVAEANRIVMVNEGTYIDIRQGGQLKHNSNTVPVAMRSKYDQFTGEKDHYYLIALPFSEAKAPLDINNSDYNSYFQRLFIDPSNNGINENYDLFKFDQSHAGAEWRNYKAETFSLERTKGYLYAQKMSSTYIVFDGRISPSKDDVEVTLAKSETPFGGWNLVGNPFACNAYINKDYYRIVEVDDGGETTHSELQLASGAIAPLEGVFVQATTNGETLTFSRDEQTRTQPTLNINVTQAVTGGSTGSTALVDMARVRFGNGGTLEKFQIDPNHTKVFIPMEGKDYAVAMAEGSVGEIPVNFKAEKNGTYTLGFTNEEVEFGYLHLIDNKTGADVDLLANPAGSVAEYTFEARTTDYASRFRLVFKANQGDGPSTGSGTFAYFNGSGEIVLTIEPSHGASLQIVDMLGRVIRCTDVARSVSTNGMTPGVYVLRLVSGGDVKTQKIVVR